MHADHLNTPRRLFDAQGNTVWQWPFSGFGETPPGIAADGFAVDGSSLPIPNMPRIEFDLRYPGQVFDKESGLFANHHRVYDPSVGRYITADPIGLAGGWNRYGYVGGNPLLHVDPLGLASDIPWWRDMWRPDYWSDLSKPITPPGNCATAECAAGLPPAKPEIRPQSEIDKGQCRLVCTISTMPIQMFCSATFGTVAGLASTAGRAGVCHMVCN